MSEPQAPQFRGNGGEMGEEKSEFGFRSSELPPKDEPKQKFEISDDDYCPSTGQTPSPAVCKPTIDPEHRKLNSLVYGAFTLTSVSGQP